MSLKRSLIDAARMFSPITPPGVRRWGAARYGELAAKRVSAIARRVAASSDPVLVGPWLGEVGFELLYWIPFLRWLLSRHGIPKRSLIAISRGGVGSWYEDVADRYVDLFDFVTPERLARMRRRRAASDGGQKQVSIDAVDRELLQAAAVGQGLLSYEVLHPSLMADLFRPYWWGLASTEWVRAHCEHRLLGAPCDLVQRELPEHYVACRFYFNDAMVDTEANREHVRRLLAALARDRAVVVLRGDVGIDEHSEAPLPDGEFLVIEAGDDPVSNLALQSSVIGEADAFVGTYGGFAYLAPSLGTPALALFADDGFLRTHLRLAQSVFNTPPLGSLDVRPFSESTPDAAIGFVSRHQGNSAHRQVGTAS